METSRFLKPGGTKPTICVLGKVHKAIANNCTPLQPVTSIYKLVQAADILCKTHLFFTEEVMKQDLQFFMVSLNVVGFLFTNIPPKDIIDISLIHLLEIIKEQKIYEE